LPNLPNIANVSASNALRGKVVRQKAFLLLLVVIFGSPRAAEAQTVGTMLGAVDGVVFDSTGAVLSGVTVQLSGGALMGMRTTVTNGEGRYRFPAVPPGEYTIVFARESFRTVTRAVSVGVGLTGTVTATLPLSSLKQEIAVQPRASAIDSQSTTVTVSFDARRLDALPGNRGIQAIHGATPAVQPTRFDVGGNTAAPGAGTGATAYGTGGADRPTVEGILIGGFQPAGFSLDYGAFSEISVSTAAHSSEWPTPGLVTQFIGKSGGNQYRGTLYADYENGAWQAFNIDADQIGRGATGGETLSPRDTNRLWAYRDLNADIGGYIKRDTAWWYSSLRDQNVAARFVNFPVKPHETRLSSYSGKLTYRPARNHTLLAFAQVARNYQPNRLDGFTLVGTTAINRSEESTAEYLAWGRVWKGEWNAFLDDTMYFELRAGEFAVTTSESSRSTADRFEDAETKEVQGGNRDWQRDLRRAQAHGSLSYFKDDWFGNHHFKFGGTAIRNATADIWRSGYPRDVLHVVAADVPKQVYLFQTPSRSENGYWTYSAYANDSWRLTRLTVNPGLRFDRYRVFFPEQHHLDETYAAVSNVIDWNVIAPRIAAAYDLTGNGRTLLKASYGQYWITPGDLGANVNPNATEWLVLYRWSDLDGSGNWNPGEEVGPPQRRRGGAANESLDPNLRLSYLREVTGWLERDVVANVGIRAGVVWRGGRQQYMRQDRNRPFEAFTETRIVSDPGPDGRVGTGDDGPDLRVSDVRSVSAARENIVRNVPNADTDYLTWEITANRRFSGTWSLVAGFTHTRSRDHASAYFGQAVRENSYPVTPNDLINTGRNGRHEFTTWSAKIHGTYEAPWNVRITPFLRHQSGQPFGRTVTLDLSYGRVPILTEPIGTRRMDNVTLLDVRVEKRFQLMAGQHVAGFVDVFNLLNANPAQTIIWSSEAFLQPVSIVAPRIIRVGVKLEW
jgi:hypothetical protein